MTSSSEMLNNFFKASAFSGLNWASKLELYIFPSNLHLTFTNSISNGSI